MITGVENKNSTSTGFENSAEYYNEYASVQKEVAERLLNALDPWKETLPAGPILELGCGTGFLTKGITKLLPGREFIITDASDQMLEACKKNVGSAENVSYEKLEAKDVLVDEPTYAMTLSSFAAQWFHDPPYTLAQWLKVTKPGGLLLAAFPGNDSFPEWKKHAETLGLPFTGNELPDTEEMVIKLSSDVTQVDYYEDTIRQKFDSAADFFRHLKQIGAGTQLSGRHLTPKEMRLLINHWDDSMPRSIFVSWHVVFLAVKRNLG